MGLAGLASMSERAAGLNGRPVGRLPAYSRSLKEVFESTLTIRHISSPLASFDGARTASKIRAWMNARDFDQVGVRDDGVVSGFVSRNDLGDGQLWQFRTEFDAAKVVDAEEPLLEALRLLRDHGVVFVRTLGDVNGIATTADVGRPPVRLWLFGLVMICEMQLTRLIKKAYPNDAWTQFLSSGQRKKANEEFERRRRVGKEIDLASCLTLKPKIDVVTQADTLRVALQLGDSRAASLKLERLRSLRNDLAHGDDILDRWPEFLGDAEEMERLIAVAEPLSSADFRSSEE
jgi:hypothetical protein